MAPTVQEAVDSAKPGDTVQIAAGEYNESVVVRTDDLIIRGEDRNQVVFNGKDVKSNGIVITGDGVRVENLSVQNYTLNGVLVTGMSTQDGGLARGSDGYERLDPEQFPPIDGFAVRYVSAHNNGLYGIYAFDAQNGVLEHNYASGSSDSGLYVGQCQDCNVLVKDNVSESNAVGYEQTNASNTVTVINNRFTGNRLGVTLLSDYQEAFIPLKNSVVAGNLIGSSNNPQTPAHGEGGYGIGIGISGAQDVLVTKNRILENPISGVEVTSAEDLAPKNVALKKNQFDKNKLDLLYTASSRAPGSGLCLDDPELKTLPSNLGSLWDCEKGSKEAAGAKSQQYNAPAGVSYRKIDAGPEQPNIPADDAFSFETLKQPNLKNVTVPTPELFHEQVRKAN